MREAVNSVRYFYVTFVLSLLRLCVFFPLHFDAIPFRLSRSLSTAPITLRLFIECHCRPNLIATPSNRSKTRPAYSNRHTRTKELVKKLVKNNKHRETIIGPYCVLLFVFHQRGSTHRKRRPRSILATTPHPSWRQPKCDAPRYYNKRKTQNGQFLRDNWWWPWPKPMGSENGG